jgi:pimeloyl-ACP methyl ester carboxylesterase
LLLVPLFTALAPPAAHAAQSGDFVGLVDVGGGRRMYLECRGAGSPTVVLVAGLRGCAEDWNIAGKPGPRVFPVGARFTTVCAYVRPGTPVGQKPSRSDPVPQPTTAGAAVADLHALLTAAGEAGPYVLVAHSYGGLIGRLYASTYPDEVSGLVLVDTLSEGLRDAETPEQWAIQRKLIEGDVREGVAQYPALETIDVDRSFDQVHAAAPLRPLPPVVLSADRGWGPQVPSMIAAGTLPADVPRISATSPMPRRRRRRRNSRVSWRTPSTSPRRTAATRSTRSNLNSSSTQFARSSKPRAGGLIASRRDDDGPERKRLRRRDGHVRLVPNSEVRCPDQRRSASDWSLQSATSALLN